MGEPWFGVKRHGFGLSPRSTAGWIATGVLVAALVATPLIVAALHGPRWAAYAGIAGLGAAFTLLVASKNDGRRWRWRWGGR